MKALALLTFCLGTTAVAADFSFLPAATDAQKEFKSDLQSQNMKAALEDWTKAFADSSYAATEDGKAVRLYVLAANGLPISALQRLIAETEASDLSPAVMQLWKPTINAYVTELPPGLEIRASWTRHFSSISVHITKKSQIAFNLKRAAILPNDDLNKARILWAVATMAPQFNDTASALQALNSLRSCKQSIIGADQIELAVARVLYQKGDVKAAMEHDNAVPKSSDLWLEALEERSWAHLRSGDANATVSDLTTLLSSSMAPLLGPEPYFLSELTSLKICDYPKILKTSQLFKERHRDRLKEMEELASTGANKALPEVLDGFDHYGYSLRAAGENAVWMPRNFLRDGEFANRMKLHLDLLTEDAAAEKISDKAADVAGLVAKNPDIAEAARNAAAKRLRSLAKSELAEYKLTINKLHIIEAEVIERLYVDESLQGQRKDTKPVDDGKNMLSFPYSEKEVWLDELDHYKANVKDCPALPGTKGASL